VAWNISKLLIYYC